jgi:hypothetical protein
LTLQGPVIPVSAARLSMAADCGFCAVFKDRGEAYNAGLRSTCADAFSSTRLRLPPADAGLSKLNSMLGSFCGRGRLCSPSSKGTSRRTAIQPGSVDMLGPTARMPSGPSRSSLRARGRTVAAIGALLCAP